MDASVMIRFIEFLDNLFGRINSKRLMIYLALLLFLAYAYAKTPSDFIISIAAGGAFITALLYFFKTPDDKLNAAKIEAKKIPAIIVQNEAPKV